MKPNEQGANHKAFQHLLISFRPASLNGFRHFSIIIYQVQVTKSLRTKAKNSSASRIHADNISAKSVEIISIDDVWVEIWRRKFCQIELNSVNQFREESEFKLELRCLNAVLWFSNTIFGFYISRIGGSCSVFGSIVIISSLWRFSIRSFSLPICFFWLR